jgi:hypothetical protein
VGSGQWAVGKKFKSSKDQEFKSYRVNGLQWAVAIITELQACPNDLNNAEIDHDQNRSGGFSWFQCFPLALVIFLIVGTRHVVSLQLKK